MGLPILRILGTLKLKKVEQVIEEKFRDKIKNCVRYVDEIFAIMAKGKQYN